MYLNSRSSSSQNIKNNFFNIINSNSNEHYSYEKINKNNNINNTNNFNNDILAQNIRFSPNIINMVNKSRNPKERFKKFHLNNISMPLIIDDKTFIQNIDNLPDNKKKIKQYETISDPKYKRIYIKKNINNFITGKEYEKRISKSQSDVNIKNIKDYYNYLNMFNYIPKQVKYVGKEITDVTNDEIFDKYTTGNNHDYLDYIDKYKEISLYNKLVMENKKKQKKLENDYNILNERNKIKQDNEYYNKLFIEDQLKLKEKQKKYKNSLDNQIKHIIENKLNNENLSYRDFIKNNAYDRQKMKTPVREFLNKNDYVDVNPYNNRRSYLGESNLENNTILNPRIQFKINKYIFPKIINNKYKSGNINNNINSNNNNY